MSQNLNGLALAANLIAGLWNERPREVAKMSKTGLKYFVLKDAQKASFAITDAQIAAHVHGFETFAASLIGADHLAKSLVIDIDSGGQAILEQLLACAAATGLTAFAFSLPANANDSQHDGGHVWILYQDAWSPERLREQSKQLLHAASLPADKEIYPSNAKIRLPFSVHVRKNTRGTLLLQDRSRYILDNDIGLAEAVTAVFCLPLNTVEPPPAPPTTPKRRYAPVSPVAGNITPLDAYDAQATDATTAALIEAAGWTPCSTPGYYARPGKSPKDGHSATLGFKHPGWLSVFSDSDPLLPGKAPEGIHYSPGKIYTILCHNGNYSAAAKALYAANYGSRLGVPSVTPPSNGGGIGIGTGPQPSALPQSPQLDRVFIVRCLDMDEAGDAELSERLFKGRLVFGAKSKIWYKFGLHAWTPLDNPPRSLIWRTVAATYLTLAAEEQKEPKPDTKLIDELYGRARQLRAAKRINNVLTLTQELLSVDDRVWDADPWLLGVENGVLDLRSGLLRAGQPDDYIRTVAPTTWCGIDEPAPRWVRFINEIMSDETDRAAFLQRLLGYALNGSTEEHVLAVFIGERGRNGKRVLFEILQHVLGAYAGSISTDVLIGQEHRRSAGSAQPHLMDLQGKRITYCSETDESDHLSTAQVKFITGGDPITARKLHANLVTFRPTHTIFLQTNRKPQAPADDDALWSRIIAVEFKTRFVEQPTAADERLHEPNLEATLRGEASGILAWLVRGGLEWQRGGLQPPESVRLARDMYRKGESIDSFLEASCVEDVQALVEGNEIYRKYVAWCNAEGLRPKSNNWLGGQLAVRFEKGRTVAGRSCYHGIRVLRDVSGLEQTAEYHRLNSEAHVPSASIGTPNTDCHDPISESTTPFSKSFGHAPSHEEKKLHMPSVPSAPSDDVTLGPKATGIILLLPPLPAPAIWHAGTEDIELMVLESIKGSREEVYLRTDHGLGNIPASQITFQQL